MAQDREGIPQGEITPVPIDWVGYANRESRLRQVNQRLSDLNTERTELHMVRDGIGGSHESIVEQILTTPDVPPLDRAAWVMAASSKAPIETIPGLANTYASRFREVDGALRRPGVIVLSFRPPSHSFSEQFDTTLTSGEGITPVFDDACLGHMPFKVGLADRKDSNFYSGIPYASIVQASITVDNVADSDLRIYAGEVPKERERKDLELIIGEEAITALLERLVTPTNFKDTHSARRAENVAYNMWRDAKSNGIVHGVSSEKVQKWLAQKRKDALESAANTVLSGLISGNTYPNVFRDSTDPHGITTDEILARADVMQRTANAAALAGLHRLAQKR